MPTKAKQKNDKKHAFFDRQRIESGLNSSIITAPQGMTREQKRVFMSGSGGVK